MLKNTNLNLKTICHTRPDRVSRGMIFNNKEYYTAGSSGRADACPRMTEECGRSMVEMLGVLAVMGVLSVAGIAGFNSAMNKYRANELLNEASKRAAIVAAQVLQGRETLSISEFGTENTRLNFSETVDHDTTNNQFTLTITGVAEAVCQQMKNTKGPVIRKFEPATCADDATVKLTFNDDMSTTPKASDFNTDATGKECTDSGFNWCSGASTPTCQVDCCAGKAVSECQKCNSAGAVLESAAEGETCDYSATGNDGVCHNGACVQKSTEANCVAGGVRCNDTTYGECCPAGYTCTTNGDTPGVCKKFTSGCTTNDDCTGSNQYCEIAASSCTSITSGTCNPLGTPVSASISGLGNVIASPSTMNWWSAKNWCEAQGKHLINIEDFQAYRSGQTTKVVANTGWSYGCASGKTCGSWSSNGMWKGTSGTDARTLTSSGETLQENYSPVLVALAKEFKGVKDYFWTASDYNNDSCFALNVNLSSGAVYSYRRSNDNGYALCE